MNSKLASIPALLVSLVAGCAQPIVCPTWLVYDPTLVECVCDADAGARLNDTYDGCTLPDGGTVPLPGVDGGRRDGGPPDLGAALDLGARDVGPMSVDFGFDAGAMDAGPADLGPGDAGPLQVRVGEYLKASNTAPDDRFGFSVALSADGSTLAVGSYSEDSGSRGIGGNQSDNTAEDSGAVYVFRRTDGVWTQEAYIKASNTDDDDYFGYALALSADGNTLAVGAQREDSGGTGVGSNEADNSAPAAGAAYLFRRTGTFWTQEAYLKPSRIAANDLFGFAVAISSDGATVAVSAGNQGNATVAVAGAVFLYRRSAGSWREEARVDASNPGYADGFGRSVALSADGSVLAVGATGEDSAAVGVDGNQANEAAQDSGAAYVFRRMGVLWAQDAYLKASNTGAGDRFGWAVALSADGTTLAVTAPGEASSAGGVAGNQNDNASPGAGAAYVFRRASDAWTQHAYIKPSNAAADDSFGWSAALEYDGLVLTVGALGEDSNATGIDGNQSDNSAMGSGAVYLFRQSGAWVQEAYVKAPNTGANDAFAVVALSSEGTLAIGANGEASAATGINGNQADNSAMGAGAVYTYRY